MKRVVVIGGGVTGLTAVHRLLQKSRESGPPVEAVLLEASPRLGGAIQTVHESGFVMEKGPDCFLSIKPEGVALCRELGLESRLMGTNPSLRQSFILRGRRLIPVPQGFYLLAPIRFGPFLTTPIFSPWGKLRMAFDLVLPRRRAQGDESLSDFVRRRFGREALERMAQPMVAGIYSADPEDLSLEATMPQFLEMERKHRSVILALRRQMRARKKGAAQGGSGTGGGASASGPRYGLFAALDGGMEVLVDALRERTAASDVRTGARVVGLRRDGERWHVGVEGQGEVETDAVCMCADGARAAGLVRSLSPRLAELMERTSFGSLATLNLAYRREQVAHPLDGMGFVVPEAEGRTLLACSFSSSKFAGRAPEGKVLIRAFLGGARAEAALALSDEDLIRRVRGEVEEVLGVRGEPELTLFQRYQGAMPQYKVGHLDRVRAIEQEAATLPGLAFAGKSYRGVGIPDCAASAQGAVQAIMEFLSRQNA